MNTIVLEETENGDVAVDIYQKLANDRILFITDEITDDLTNYIVATLLLKDAEDSESKITIFLNSTGGSIRNILTLYDTISILNSPIEMICVGTAIDGAAVLLAASTPGLRYASINSFLAIEQVIHDWYIQTDLSNAKKLLTQAQKDNNRLLDILSKSTGKTIKQIKEDFDSKVFFNAKEACAYGLIDHVIQPNKRRKNVKKS